MEEFKFLKCVKYINPEFRISFVKKDRLYICGPFSTVEVLNDFLKENYKEVSLSFDNVDHFIQIISEQKCYPEKPIAYQLGKYVTEETLGYARYAKTLYIQNRNRNILTIQAFCLFCIRYHRDRINKDVRRKICEYIIDFID